MKKLSITFLVIISLQSCTAFYKTTVPIHQAVNGKSVKIIDQTGAVQTYRYLELHDDSLYYGFKRNKNLDRLEITQIPEPYDSYKVYLKNPAESLISSMVAGYFIIGVPLGLIMYSLECENNSYYCF